MTTDEWDDQAKRDWLRWEIDTLQTEWERSQAQRYSQASELDADGWDAEWRRDVAQHHMPEHTTAKAPETVADDTLHTCVPDVKGMGRGVRYATGVTAPDGHAETTSTWLCWLCDREAEYAGYCEEHYALWREEYSLEQLLEHDEWVEDAYSREQLERVMREQEERRNDH